MTSWRTWSIKYSEVSGIFALLTAPVAISRTNLFLRSLQKDSTGKPKCLKNTVMLLYIKLHMSGDLTAE